MLVDRLARGDAAGLFAAIVPVTRELGPTGRGTLAFIAVTAIVCATLARFGVTEATTVKCAQKPLRPVLLSNLLTLPGRRDLDLLRPLARSR